MTGMMVANVGQAIQPADLLSSGSSRLKAGCGQDCPPHKTLEAAEQFEALLLSQILRSARESGEEKGDSVTEFAEQHLASALAHNGGLGLAAMISKGLSKTPGV